MHIDNQTLKKLNHVFLRIYLGGNNMDRVRYPGIVMDTLGDQVRTKLQFFGILWGQSQ